ncbi:larval cuticle protein III/IV-like [Euwallacea fornicatus]|uniref:larval cuticle protein III/IV-like n=1 Tax=Euwallacea fornicatus TaxID=995702 RepID=UPI00338F98D9
MFLMYGFLMISFAAMWATQAALQPQLPVVPILYSKADISPEGYFQWSYESGDGSKQEQSGHEIVPEGGQALQGSAEWVDPEGGVHQLRYEADERGYLPSSADLPVAPAVPEAILKGLQWNAAHPEEETET